MLCNLFVPRLSEFDRQVYEMVVRPDHYLAQLLKTLAWDDFQGILAPYYCEDQGRPATLPVLMLKLEYLRYHHNLSDREVIARCETDLSFRFFLQIPLRCKLPNPSSLCIFRGRLGVKGYREVFHHVVHLAREQGVVKDRLRIKDATHVIANIAAPTALALVAQTRDKLLASAEPFAPLLVEGERCKLELLREVSLHQPPAERLVSRVAQLQDILDWADDLPAPENALANRAWQTFCTQRDLAHQILEDQEHPRRGDRIISTTDPDARRGKHGEWYDGYLTDILIDADSQIITAVNVLPASGDEAADALELIVQEETAHGNDVQAMSIDGVGFNGPLLRELENPDGLNISAYVPVPKNSEQALFGPQDFQEDPSGQSVTCPAGKTSHQRYYDAQAQTTKHRFRADVCRACPSRERCMKQAPTRHGRTVCKSDYQREHDRARQKTTTSQYRDIRREHPAVERKLGEMMNRHGGRRARYRGHWKVHMQELMVATVTNVKRLVRLECALTGAQ
jgi:transposase